LWQESLRSIAQQLGMTWLQLWAFNKDSLLKADVDLTVGSSLRVGQLYQVEEGDSLYALADRLGTTISALRKMNADIPSSGLIYPGQVFAL